MNCQLNAIGFAAALGAIGWTAALGARSLKSQQPHSLYNPAALKNFLSKHFPTSILVESNNP